MLYQTRNSRSKQLDEQVVGRVRRNPRLLDYEDLPEEAQQLATTAWVWGIQKSEKGKTFAVRLQDDQSDIMNQVRIKTTRIKPLTEKEDYDISNYISNQKPIVAHKSIFDINRQLQAVDYSIIKLVYSYADNYSKWWEAAERVNDIAKESNKYMCDYKQSMEINEEHSFSPTSFYVASNLYVSISDWVWKRRDGAEKFSFDSEAERDWADILQKLSYKGSIASITTGLKKANPNAGLINLFGELETDITGEEKEIFLWGKNYVSESRIKFEYYLGALHSSYPDFIMKDKFDRIHIFEVKSVNQSPSFSFDNNIYISKVAELKKCYLQASKLTGHLFYLPVLRDDVWRITLLDNGTERTLTLEQFRKFVTTLN